MNRVLISLVLACVGACAWSSDVKKDVVAEEKIAVDETVIKTQDASKTNTKTVHEESAVIIVEPDGTLEIVRLPTKGLPVKLPKGAKVAGTVPINTTTVDQAKIVGAKSETAKLDVADVAKIVDQTETTKKTGMSLQIYFIAISVVIVLLVAGFLYIRFLTPKI